ncbi:uncharacterized protein LOC120686117 [Panicum virgatum]|uniref:Uncharacterized protein n=1 Tax=Panicum virgatum TaxID=38727 RepID=A0A8T0P8D5_PANVG|nr:uncharacterized protein LOC120686117 [Panicum virgatum]KAG2557870.1 hypothetical protein PVAP13_8NG224600 [Panicum virgatum]
MDPKKRKSRAKQGRPLGSGKGDGSTSTPKKQKTAREPGEVTSSPGPVTRRQSAAGTSSPGPVTRSQSALSMEGGALTIPVTPTRPTKSPEKRKKAAVKKKLTPRKATK